MRVKTGVVTQCTSLALDVIVSSQLMTGTFADAKMLTNDQVAHSFLCECSFITSDTK